MRFLSGRDQLPPGMAYAKNDKKSCFRVLDGTEARNSPYIGSEKRN